MYKIADSFTIISEMSTLGATLTEDPPRMESRELNRGLPNLGSADALFISRTMVSKDFISIMVHGQFKDTFLERKEG
jgi:hypothetical protein